MEPLLPNDPKKLGVWTVTGRLGKGGMGAVYMAHNKDRRTAAIKVISGSDIKDEKVRDRFKQEIQALSLITTPYVARLYDYDLDAKNPWYAAEYVSDMSLADVLNTTGSFTGDRWWKLAQHLITALEAIHDKGVIHRDLKPGNIMIVKSQPKLIDFGLAKPVANFDGGAAGTTRTELAGTPNYMSPEQWGGLRDVDEKTDIWAIGITLIDAAGGRAWGEMNQGQIKEALRKGKLPDVSKLDHAQRALVTDMVIFDADERLSASALRKRLVEYFNTRPAPAAAEVKVEAKNVGQPNNIKFEGNRVVVEDGKKVVGAPPKNLYVTSDGKPITVGMRVKYLKTGQLGLVTKLDPNNTNYVFVMLMGEDTAKVKSTNQLVAFEGEAKAKPGHKIVGTPKKGDAYVAKEASGSRTYWPQEPFPLAKPRERVFAALLDFLIFFIGVGIVWSIWYLKIAKTGLTPGRKIVGLVIIESKTHIPVPTVKTVTRGLLFTYVAYGSFVFIDIEKYAWIPFIPILLALPMLLGRRQTIWDVAFKTTVGKFEKTDTQTTQ
jgi:serine/threonine protein kinase